jgi:hypothetical protein
MRCDAMRCVLAVYALATTGEPSAPVPGWLSGFPRGFLPT